MIKAFRLTMFAAAVAGWPVAALPADQVVMENGDTLNGKVLSLSTNALVLQNDNVGIVTLSRAKIAVIHFGMPTAPNATSAEPAANLPARQPVAAQTNLNAEFASAVRGIRQQTNLVSQVQSQILGSGSPDAVNKFNEMLDGLSTGKMGLNDLRQQAQSADDQLRSLKKDLGPDADDEVDGYLTILDKFLQETAPATNSNSTAAPATEAGRGRE